MSGAEKKQRAARTRRSGGGVLCLFEAVGLELKWRGRREEGGWW
jgi:hypothetical protein